jgi:hypothetical protein
MGVRLRVDWGMAASYGALARDAFGRLMEADTGVSCAGAPVA